MKLNFALYIAVMEVLQSIVSDFEKDLECPVCLSIPREMPIPACPAGHIVCRTCKTKVQECPTCKRKYPNGELEITNSLAASLIDKVPHRCKYHDFKCEVKMKLSEIVKHEKQCQERTVKCPHLQCGQEVQLKKFHEHVMNGKTTPCGSEMDGGNGGWLTPLSTGYLKWDGVSFRENDDFDLTKDKLWDLTAFEQHGKTFYLSDSYIAEKKTFIFCVFLAEGEEVSSNYNVKLEISSSNISRKKLTYDGPVISIDSITSTVKNPQTIFESWSVQYEAIKPHLFIQDQSKNNNNHIWRVELPMKVLVTKLKT